jgi:outer membrane protein TolC
MKLARGYTRISFLLAAVFFVSYFSNRLAAEPLPLKRAVELALSHGASTAIADADQQRAFASYHEARNQYLPALVVGSGLGKSWGYPLSLEGSAPSIVNLTSQSALINPSLRDFVRAAKSEWQASSTQAKDVREQVIQDTVLAYAELSKWERLNDHLKQDEGDARTAEQIVENRIAESIDSPLTRNQARLATARAHLRITEAAGAIAILRNRLSQLTGLPAVSIETVEDSIPPLPEIKSEDDLAQKAVQSNLAVQAVTEHSIAQGFRARGEHRALWPTIDFAAQYALLASFNNYEKYFRSGSFQQHNATVGIVMRFPFVNPSQHAHAQAADAEALHAKKQIEVTKNQVSEETMRLQRAVDQLAAAQEVADLSYQVASANLDAIKVRLDAGSAHLHDADEARTQATERYNSLQEANFEVQKARILLLRATRELEPWVKGEPLKAEAVQAETADGNAIAGK